MSHRNRDINDPRLINLSQEIDDPNDPEYVPLDDAGSQIYSGFILNPYLKVFMMIFINLGAPATGNDGYFFKRCRQRFLIKNAWRSENVLIFLECDRFSEIFYESENVACMF